MKIAVLGAGRSAGFLIEYLAQVCEERNWKLTVCDREFTRLKKSFRLTAAVDCLQCDLSNSEVVEQILQQQNAAVSLLPPAMHVAVAKLGLSLGIPVFTASYISPAMRELDSEAVAKGVLLMNELGLDPGIDHLSANSILDRIEEENKALELEEKWSVISFESHCGGLVYNEDCLDNPWGYKFSWNPTNVILAGQGGMSIYKEGGKKLTILPEDVFRNSKQIQIPGIGDFDVYPNRDSLGYERIYGLEGSDTLLRGTLRRNGYCKAWQYLIDVGLTRTDKCLPSNIGSASMAFSWITGYACKDAWISSLRTLGNLDGETEKKLSWLPLGDDAFWTGEIDSDLTWFAGKSAAQFLEKLLLKCWKLEEMDRDEVVMYHRLVLQNARGKIRSIASALQVIGEGGDRTAMAKTVGLPLAIGLIQYLDGDRLETGVQMPWGSRWYLSILPILEGFGIRFIETEG